MNKDMNEKWIKALRSGEYEQGKGYLLWEGKWCCLGVLADACGLGKWNPSTGKGVGLIVNGDSYYTDLPPDILAPGIQDILITMNDLKKSDFGEIADWIEGNYDIESGEFNGDP
jgi:hypothetical protein